MNAQLVDNYWDLHLNAETGRYVYRMLALREVMEHPERFGFHLGMSDVYAPLEGLNFTVSASIDDLASFSLDHGTTLRELKVLNPWLRKDHLEVRTGHSYTLRIPA